MGVAIAALTASPALADEVPLNLQVQLLSKMATYVSSGHAEAGPTKVLVVYPGAAPSRGAQTISSALSQVGQFGASKVEVKLEGFTDVKKLQATLFVEKPQFVYLAPELDEKAAAAIVEAIGTSAAVTVASVGDHVKLGVVLGFSLVEAKPRVLLNLKQAQKQSIALHSGLTRHAVVVER